MQNSILRHIYYTPLDSMTWCATAQVQPPLQSIVWPTLFQPLAPNILCSYHVRLHDFYWQQHSSQRKLSALKNAANKRQQQRSGVRLLLQYLLSKLGITDTLDESQFPYRLVNSRYYVCFSHSGNSQLNDKVAVVISLRHAVGIDIEVQDVAWHVAQRFYHPNEIASLNKLSIAERAHISKYLWQLKESFIKIHQYKLAQGLGIDYSYTIPKLIDSITAHDFAMTPIIIKNKHTDYQITILPLQQVVVIF